MKKTLSLSFAFATILCASSFATQPEKFKVDHKATHDSVNHEDATGVATLATFQHFKMLNNGKMVPLGTAKTHMHVAATKEVHDDPDLEKKVMEGLADDPATLSIFTSLATAVKGIASTVASKAGSLISTGINAVKSLVSNPGVQQAAKEAVVGGAITTGLALTTAALTSKSSSDPAAQQAAPVQ